MARKKKLPGLIEPNRVYTLQEIEERLGLGLWALRKARAAGLKVAKIGRRNYIKGSDLLEFLDRQAKAQAAG